MQKSTGRNINKYHKRVDHEGAEEKDFVKDNTVKYLDESEENKIYLNLVKTSITVIIERKTKYEIKKRVYTTYKNYEIISLEKLLQEKVDNIEKSLDLKDKEKYKIISITKLKHIGYANLEKQL